MDILVFAPHPDDDLIGCGGSIIRHLKEGGRVSVVYMTSGEAGSLKHTKRELAAIREKEAAQAGDLLGIHDLIFFRNADGYLKYSRQNLIRCINLIRDKKPQILYVPHAAEGHKDHKTTHEIVLEAVRRAGGPWFQECTGQSWTVESLLGYEVGTPLREVSYVEDITPFISLKMQALQLHKSQIVDIPYDEAAGCLNRYRGVTTGRGAYCECFQALLVGKI